MVEQAWLKDGNEIVPKIFVENHTNGKCVSKEKIVDKLIWMKCCKDDPGVVQDEIENLLNELQ